MIQKLFCLFQVLVKSLATTKYDKPVLDSIKIHFPKFERIIIQCSGMLSNLRSMMFQAHFQFESLSGIVF